MAEGAAFPPERAPPEQACRAGVRYGRANLVHKRKAPLGIEFLYGAYGADLVPHRCILVPAELFANDPSEQVLLH